MGALTPIGNDWATIESQLRSLNNGVSYMPESGVHEGLRCRLTAVVPEFELPVLKSGRAGVSYGSSSGSPPSIMQFGEMLINHRTDKIRANTYVRMMPHTTAINIGIFFGMTGRIIPAPAPVPPVARPLAMPL